MEFEIGNIGVMYPNEEISVDRKLRIRTDGDILQFDLIDPEIESGCCSLDKNQVELLVDTLKLVLKNKLIE